MSPEPIYCFSRINSKSLFACNYILATLVYGSIEVHYYTPPLLAQINIHYKLENESEHIGTGTDGEHPYSNENTAESKVSELLVQR